MPLSSSLYFLSCGIASPSRESNHDGEYDVEALLARLDVSAKSLKGGYVRRLWHWE